MEPGQQALQQAISLKRTPGKKLRSWVLLSCENARCSAQEVNVFVDETQPDALPWQAPAYCPRCRNPLKFEGFER